MVWNFNGISNNIFIMFITYCIIVGNFQNRPNITTIYSLNYSTQVLYKVQIGTFVWLFQNLEFLCSTLIFIVLKMASRWHVSISFFNISVYTAWSIFTSNQTKYLTVGTELFTEKRTPLEDIKLHLFRHFSVHDCVENTSWSRAFRWSSAI